MLLSMAKITDKKYVHYLLTSSQIHQIKLSTEFFFSFYVFLFNINEEDAVASRAVLIHIYGETIFFKGFCLILSFSESFKMCQHISCCHSLGSTGKLHKIIHIHFGHHLEALSIVSPQE